MSYQKITIQNGRNETAEIELEADGRFWLRIMSGNQDQAPARASFYGKAVDARLLGNLLLAHALELESE